MASPDFTPYIDLSLYDKDAQDIYDTAVQLIQESLPDWQPREGNTEVLLLEGLALEVAEIVYALNRLPSGIMEALLRFFQVERDYGAVPTCTVTFHMAGTDGYSVPAGTRFSVQGESTADPIIFSTTTELTVPGGQSSGTVTAEADEYTDVVNGIPAGTQVSILDSIIYADYAVLATPVTGGRNAEPDDDYLQRGVNRFTRLSTTLVLPKHFTAYALENPAVSRATTLDAYNPVADVGGDGPVGNDPGHVAVVVYGSGGPVGGPDKTALLAEMEEASQVNLTVHVIDATVVNQNITTTVMALSGWDAADVVANVEAALDSYLDPQVWPWSGVIRYNELIQLISNAEGVDYVVSLTPNSDVTLTNVASLVDLGTVSVTVNTP